jgi:hypothetical protein
LVIKFSKFCNSSGKLGVKGALVSFISKGAWGVGGGTGGPSSSSLSSLAKGGGGVEIRVAVVRVNLWVMGAGAMVGATAGGTGWVTETIYPGIIAVVRVNLWGMGAGAMVGATADGTGWVTGVTLWTVYPGIIADLVFIFSWNNLCNHTTFMWHKNGLIVQIEEHINMGCRIFCIANKNTRITSIIQLAFNPLVVICDTNLTKSM